MKPVRKDDRFIYYDADTGELLDGRYDDFYSFENGQAVRTIVRMSPRKAFELPPLAPEHLTNEYRFITEMAELFGLWTKSRSDQKKWFAFFSRLFCAGYLSGLKEMKLRADQQGITIPPPVTIRDFPDIVKHI